MDELARGKAMDKILRK
ncbi:MAG TPA: hypothetical protein VE422_09765 [Terriglobia bacterium]|nr:hypothetical protein [Terriglobia bacterium]